MDKKKKIALFGGSFNPPHKEHIEIIKKLAEKFDKVVVLPCHISPFKPDAVNASAEARYDMLRSVSFPKNVKVSKYELKREGTSYSYLTAEHYAEKYPEGKLYFVIGSDGLDSLDRWERADVLASTVRFYVIEREGFPIEDRRVAELEAKGFKIKVSGLKCPDISSSAVKVSLAFGKHDGLNAEVADYISSHGLYDEYAAITARYDEFSMKPERVAHTYRATLTGIKLAKLNGVSVCDTITALLLHDIGKYASEETLKKYKIVLPEDVLAMPENIRHAPIGALIAQKAFKVKSKAILDAIRYHTSGKPKMTPLGEVVYMADFIEPGRDFPHIEDIRAVTYRNLKLGMEAGLKNVIDHLGNDGGTIFPATVETYEYYRKVNNPPPKKTRSKAQPSAVADSERIPAAVKTTAEPAEKAAAPKGAARQKAAKTEITPAAEKVKAESAEKAAAPKGAARQKAVKMEASPAAVKTTAEPAEKAAAPKGAVRQKTAKTEITPAAEKVKAGAAPKKAATFADTFTPPAAIDSPAVLADTIAFYLGEKKGKDISVIDVASRTVLADYFVLASASSTTQVRALADYVDEKLSKIYKIEPAHRDVDSKWIAVDYGSVILHIFYEELRSFYQLERLWSDGTNVKKP